jgi:hypothetical protein
MGLGSREQYWVSCDEPGCLEATDDGEIAESRSAAERDAKRSGFVNIEGKWFCEEHAAGRKAGAWTK